MAKPKGHRANKPNDSFGTVNDDSLYRGKYREEVYKDEDEEVVEAEDPLTRRGHSRDARKYYSIRRASRGLKYRL